MSSNTAKPGVKETASYVWTCKNFIHAKTFYSPEFKSSNEDSRKFQLKLYEKSSDGLKSKFVGLRIECTNFNPNTNSKLHLKCRISVLDPNDAKHCTTELNFELCDKNRAKIFSLFEREYLTANADKYLINDNLKIYCEIDVLDDPIPTNQTPAPSDALPKITEDWQQILENGDFSDFAFIVCEKELKVHKNILSVRSPVFKAMFSTDLEEKIQNRVEITDIDLEVFEQLLCYIYSGVIPNLNDYALELFVASDKYQLAELKSLCSKTLSSILTNETVVKILILSDMHSDGDLKLSCIKFITANSIQVMQTDGWKQMVKTRVELMVELYQELAIFAHSDR